MSGVETRVESGEGETELAALPAPAAVEVSLPFDPGRTDLGDAQAAQLRPVLRRLAEDPRLRLQIFAYADLFGESGSAARRLSLSRALAVRSRLIQDGVRSTRIDVRALGNNTDSVPRDRVDLVLVEP